MLGRIVEKNVGPVDTLLIYMGSGIISLLFHSFVYLSYFHQDIGGIGASGAISGLAAFAILLDPFALTFLVFGIPIPIIIVGWLQVYANLVGLLSPKESNIGYVAHLGGFMAFTVLGFFLGGKDKKKLWKGLLLNIALLAVLAAIYFIRGSLNFF
jgi:membrane associated rhomboid family serine protease